jgi:hypothetical protein
MKKAIVTLFGEGDVFKRGLAPPLAGSLPDPKRVLLDYRINERQR